MYFKYVVAIITFLFVLLSSLLSTEIHDVVQEGDLARVQELIEADNSLLEMQDDRLFTPLNWAATRGHYDVFMYLLEKGADINTVDIDGSNLLLNAAGSGNMDIIKFLVEEKDFDVNFVDTNSITPFYSSGGSGDVEVIKYFVDKGVNTQVRSVNDGTPIVSAIYSDSLTAFEYLLELGCEYDVPNQWNVAPIHYAAYRGQTEMLKILMDKGVDIFQETMNRETPFIWAVVARHFETADFLLDNGEDINRRISGGVTPVHSSYKLRPESLDYLIEKGADLTIVDSTGNTVLHAAAWSQDDELVAKLLTNGADVNAVNDDGETALVNACWRDSIDVIEVLLEHGATVDAEECKNEGSCVTGHRSPFLISVNRGKVDLVELFLNFTVEINQCDPNFERTPLHLAAIRGQADIVKMLLEKGADVNAKDCFKKTPRYYAQIYDHEVVAAILANEGSKLGKIAKKYKTDFLQQELNESEAKIWFANHGGWVFQTENNLLIVDYWSRGVEPENPCLANGWINPEEIKDFNVTVLVSHEHGDHYDPIIWEWQEAIPNIRYVLGMEVADREGYELIAPHTTLNFDNLDITAFESNDSGVGFVIASDGVTIFHPGDHANETRDFSGTYWPEIEYVKENFSTIDISMMPIRGCGLPDVESVRLGVIRTLEELQPKVFLPMHSSDDGFHYRDFIENLEEEGIEKTKLYYPLDRGDRFIFKKGKLI
jgi:ankyrin repeat protein/L-ascorbate metabolism protein UlaG (beta-lactamase superfamily)